MKHTGRTFKEIREKTANEHIQGVVDSFENASIDAQMAEKEIDQKRPVCRCKKPKHGNGCCLLCYGEPRKMGEWG